MRRGVLKSDKLTVSSSSGNLQQYCLNSSLHGLKYCGTSSLTLFERIFFGISFVLVMVLAAYFISNIWQKWQESPIIVSGNPTFTKIRDIPFPSVTICNMNQVKKSFRKTLTQERDRIFLDSICRQGDSLDNTTEYFEGNWPYVKRFLLNASQSCDHMMKMCRFGTKIISCEQNFTSVLTDEGLCCTFNGIHPKLMFKNFDENYHIENDVNDIDYMTWSPETGFMIDEKKYPFPNPVPGSGSRFGLSLLLDADIANYYCSSTSSSGFKILLHSPIETPRIANFGFSLSTGLETKIVITPKISEATDLIRRVPIEQRQCLFESENNLSYYRMYSKRNCESECSSKFMEQACGCTLFYMPRNFGNDSKICSRQKAECYEEIQYKLQNTMDQNLSCNHCLPACWEINYSREISSSVLGSGSFGVVEKILKNYNATYIRDNLAIVHIFFTENAYSGFTKNELIGFTEFLSNTGGLLGLFMGFSVISLIEIIYFFSIRPICALKRVENEKIKLNYVSKIRRVKQSPMMVSHANIHDHYMYHGGTSQNACEELQSKLISATRYMKSKLLSVWNSIVELSEDQMDEGQTSRAQYPYLD